MSTAAYTPTTWEQYNENIREQESGELIAKICLETDNWEAKAKLIAAAPDMLATLQNIIEENNKGNGISMIRIKAAIEIATL